MRGREGYYYPMTIKRMLITVVSLFKNTVVYNYDKEGNIVKELEVEVLTNPVANRHRARTYEDELKYVPIFPRIEINFNGMNLDESRLISPNTERYWNDTNVQKVVKDHQDEVLWELNGAFKDFMPLPYNYEYTIKIYTEKMDHFAQMAENIFPYFAMTNSTLRVKEFAFLNIERDINITLGNPDVSIEAEQLGDDGRRTVTCTFNITLAGYMYRKVLGSKIVKTVKYAGYTNKDSDGNLTDLGFDGTITSDEE